MTPGIHTHLDSAQYHAAPGISNSGLSIIASKTPAHYKASIDEPREETPALIEGQRLHLAILEPDEFAKRFAVAPKFDLRKNADKEAKAAWESEHPGIIGIPEDDWSRYQRIRDAVHANSLCRFLLNNGHAERSIFAQDPVTGVRVKCRPDYDNSTAHGRFLVDAKSTEDASPDAFRKSAFNYGYHRQAAFYMDVATWAGGDPAPNGFVFIAFEKKPPFGIIVYEPDAEFMDYGRKQYREALNLYAECLESDTWPCYPDVVHPLNLPKWVKPEDNDEVKDIGYVE